MPREFKNPGKKPKQKCRKSQHEGLWGDGEARHTNRRMPLPQLTSKSPVFWLPNLLGTSACGDTLARIPANPDDLVDPSESGDPPPFLAFSRLRGFLAGAFLDRFLRPFLALRAPAAARLALKAKNILYSYGPGLGAQ